jgi:hypothetical protein
MGDALVSELNIYFNRPDVKKDNDYATVLSCAPSAFESRKVDMPDIEPRTDIPDELKDTPLGKIMAKGQYAMRGTVYKYFVKCEKPGNPTAFDRVHELYREMPAEYNNVAWKLEGEPKRYGLHFV